MLVRLTQEDRAEIEQLLMREVDLNLFLLSDLEAFGYSHPQLRLWGQYVEDRLTAVMLTYRSSATFYAAPDAAYTPELFVEKLRQLPEWEFLSGEEKRIEPIVDRLTFRDVRRFRYAHIATDAALPDTIAKSPPVIRLRPIHARAYLDLRMQIQEFSDIEPATLESTKAYIKTGWWRVYGIMQSGKLISAATMTMHSKQASMVTAVMTREGFRGMGLASQIMQHMCRDAFANGKRLCLFFDNPEAGRIYHRLGFSDIAGWCRARR